MIQVVLKRRFSLTDFCRCLLLLIPICLGMIACSPSDNHTEFLIPFELSAFLKNHIHKLPGQPVEFQILSKLGEPVPYGLLRFKWVEGGRMSFQTDRNGILSMQFERDILDYEVMVSPESKGAKLRVTW